jgi:hypothetical protein
MKKTTLHSAVSLSTLHSSTAILRTLATVSAAFTPLLAQETTAHDRQAGHQAAAVFLLLRRRLLHGRRLLVAHLLLRVAILLLGWAVALLLRRVLSLRRAACDFVSEMRLVRLISLARLLARLVELLTRRTAAGTEGRCCCSSLGWPCLRFAFMWEFWF